jgi:hypothetical protein
MGRISPPASAVTPSLPDIAQPAPIAPNEQTCSAPRQYARPLDSKYANGYVEAHQRMYEAVKKFEADQRLNLVINNTVLVTLWTVVW